MSGPDEQQSIGLAEPPFLAAYMMPDGGMQVGLNPAQIPDAEIAGLILADIARHLARALVMTGASRSQEVAMKEMLDMFVAEMNAPTDLGSGSIVN